MNITKELLIALADDINNDENLLIVKSFFFANFSKITRYKYSGQTFSNLDIILSVTRYLIKFDEDIRSLFDQAADNINEQIYMFFSKDDNICDVSGRRKRFKNEEKNGFGFCGPDSVCPCKVSNRARSAKLVDKESKKNKTIITNLEKYGTPFAIQSSIVREKIEQTNLNRYGNIHFTETDEFKEKKISTIEEKYSGFHPSSLDETKKKKMNTVLQKYGKEYVLQNEEVREKIKQTNIVRYGTSHPFQNDDIKEKHKITMQERYNVSWAAHISFDPVTLEYLSNKETLLNGINTYGAVGLAKHLNVNPTTIYNYCHKNEISLPASSYEAAIADFLNGSEIVFEHNRGTIIPPYRLDFYLEQFSLAIEFNGLYWHSDAQKPKDYHFNKWKECQKKNIKLLMINEDEWLNNQLAIQNKILNLCGKSEKGPGARALNIREIDTTIAMNFAQRYHIQGKPFGSVIAYGAYYNGELISVITINKQRSTGALVISRFCTDGKIYAGLFSKFMKRLERDGFRELITFADLRYSDGLLYEKCGFEKIEIIKPDYRYVKGFKTYHKESFTKTQIQKKFGITNKTEKIAMEELGFLRIYDCGKIKYIWKI